MRDTSPSHRVDRAVNCGLWNVVPLLFNGYAKLLDSGGNWNMLSYMLMGPDEWHDNGPQDLVTVALCIQIAFDKMQLCLLSVAYAHRHNGALGSQR